MDKGWIDFQGSLKCAETLTSTSQLDMFGRSFGITATHRKNSRSTMFSLDKGKCGNNPFQHLIARSGESGGYQNLFLPVHFCRKFDCPQ